MNEADFERKEATISQKHSRFSKEKAKKQKDLHPTLRYFTHKIDKYTQRSIAYQGFTPIFKIFHPKNHTISMFYTQPLSQFTHKAVRISLRVKISWHPHPTYPPLSTLKAGLFAFTRTLREIDPY